MKRLSKIFPDGLADAKWQGVGVIVSIITLIVTIILTITVTQWVISRDTASLFISAASYYPSSDYKTWDSLFALENRGPTTAYDLKIKVKLISLPSITLEKITALYEEIPVESVRLAEKGTLEWGSFIDDTWFKQKDLAYQVYDIDVEKLNVGDQILVFIRYNVDPSIIDQLVASFLWNPGPPNNPNKIPMSIDPMVSVNNMKAFFINDVDIKGNKIEMSKSHLWEPLRLP
jgi:hypothetical protein